MSSRKTIVVTGLPRSGLTLTMQMLHAGGYGYPCVGAYPAFEEYRMAAVDWRACENRAVKLIYEGQLPPPYECDVIRLRRDPTEQAKSFNQFLTLALKSPESPIAALIKSFEQSYRELDEWAESQRSCLYLDFEAVIRHPRVGAKMLADFVGGLDVEKAASVVIARSPKCGPELLELRMV